MPTNDLPTVDGMKHPDGTFDAAVYVGGQPTGDPVFTVTAGSQDDVQQLWFRAKARWPDIHLGSGVLEAVTQGVADRNMDGL